LPVALYSGLPLPNAWDRTARKLYQALIAVYAVALSFGMASTLVGILFLVVEELAP